MLGLEFRSLARASVLRTIGRKLLGEFLVKFHAELREACVPIPDPALSDTNFFNEVAAMLQAPEDLPDRLNEAIFTIEEMASDESREHLDSVVAHAGLDLHFDPDAPPERVTLQVWLHSPDLIRQEHQKHDAVPLTSFQCFAPALPNTTPRPVCVPDDPHLNDLTVPLVMWFAQHRCGTHTTRVDLHVREHGQLWFLVRHGDTARWKRKMNGLETEFIRFTLEQEEAILFNAENDELWISARTEPERELYRTQFGLSLRGNADYFSHRRAFALDPLRTDGADALNSFGISEIRNVTLRQVQVRFEGGLHEIRTQSSENIFESLTDSALANITPVGTAGILAQAAFLVEFSDSETWRAVEICPSHTISLQRASDLGSIARWLSKSPFITCCEQISGTCRAASCSDA